MSLVHPKPVGQVFSKPGMFSIALMENARRRRFVEFFNGPPLKGSREALMKKTGLSKGRVSQLFDENQPFGERAARNLAEALRLPGDFFERTLGGPPAPPQDYADRHVVSESDWAALQELRDIEAAPPLARKLNELRADLAELKGFAKRFTQRIEATEAPTAPGSTLAEGLAKQRAARPPVEPQLIGNVDQLDRPNKGTQQEKQHGRRRPNR